MEHPHRPYDSDAYEQAVEQPISIMGMEADQAWFAGILSTLPHDQQRHLSLMLLQTIGELFPDLRGEEESDHANSHYYAPSITELQEGAGTDEDDDNDESDEDFYDEEDSERNEADDLAAPDEGADDSTPSRHCGRGTAAWGEPDTEPHYQQHVHQYPATKPKSVTPYDNDELRQARPETGAQPQQEKPGGYLSRFVSPRIRRGLTVWEELAVTIPAFMEAHITASAQNAGMLVQAADMAQAGFVTLHLLFHRTQHRRPVCRLLDLVLEAEDGALSERDFRPGGAFPPGGSDDRMQNGAPNQDGPHTGGLEIDYDCPHAGSSWEQRTQSRSNYISGRDIALHSSARAVTQLVRADSEKRA